MPHDEVTVYGAGMSGLIAAYDLARRGSGVTVHDRERGFGGSSIFNPSLHVTPLDVERTSGYLDIDLNEVFHPLSACPSYFEDLKVMFPVQGVYAVERGNRPSSLDALLYRLCREAGVEFAWGSALDRKVLDSLPPRTIIACGLNPPAYELLGVPHLRWEAWMSRGERRMQAYAWLWWDRCINEYGYFTAANGIFFDMLFSVGRGVGRDCLKRYEDFMFRREGIEHHDWDYVVGATPIASPRNPRLFQGRAVLCGTISGAIDPMLGFGISGALVTGKVAALAVFDPEGAEREFRRFNRYFRHAWWFKNRVWWSLVRPHVGMLRKAIGMAGVERVERLGRMAAAGRIPLRSAVPGFSFMSCH